jgi:hypothetical protein
MANKNKEIQDLIKKILREELSNIKKSHGSWEYQVGEWFINHYPDIAEKMAKPYDQDLGQYAKEIGTRVIFLAAAATGVLGVGAITAYDAIKRKLKEAHLDSSIMGLIQDKMKDPKVAQMVLNKAKQITGKSPEELIKDLQGSLKEGEWEEKNKPETSKTWEKLKYVMGQLGSYKVNGKMFGKKKELAAAEARIEAIINKESNKFIKDLDTLIKQTNKEFPNNLKAADFLSIVLSISACYDSIVDATKKENLPIDAANAIINDLREYVKYILDAKLAAAYSTVDESKDGITEEEYKNIDEAFGLNEDQAADVRAQFAANRAARSGEEDKADFKSTKMDTLKSNKLPMTLLGVGSALGGFSWLVNTEWFKHLFDIITPGHWTQDLATESKVLTDIKPGEGVYKLLGRVTQHKLDGNSSPTEFVNSLKQIGGGDANKGVDLLCQKGGVMMKPEEASKGLHEFLKNPSKYKNMNDLFHGSASGTGKLVPTNTTLYGTIAGKQMVSILTKVIPKVFVRGSIKTGAGYAIAKGLGAILGPIGVGLLGAGALVKIMRIKGQKTSRAATLNALYQSLRNIPGGTVIEPEGEVDTKIQVEPSPINPGPIDTATDKGTKEKGKGAGVSAKEPKGDNDDLYNTLKNVFKYIVNSRDMLGTRSADNVGTGAATRRAKEKGEKPSSEPTNKPSVTVPEGPTIKKGSEFKITGRNGRTAAIRVVSVKKDGTVEVERTDGGKIKSPMIAKDTLVKMYKLAQKKTLSEGKYITDNEVLNYLEKKLSYDKLKSFENLIKRIEQLRNKIRNAKQSKDKDFNRLVDKFKANPIMATDFQSLFDVSSANEKDMASLKALIDDIFVTVYSGKFGRGNLIDKMASTAGGSINSIKEKYYGADDPNKSFEKDAQSRDRLKNNLINFLQDAIRLFQHMYSRRRNG